MPDHETCGGSAVVLIVTLVLACAENREAVRPAPRTKKVPNAESRPPASVHRETLEPWVEPCRAALARGHADLTQRDSTFTDPRIDVRAARVTLTFGRGQTLVVDHSVTRSVRGWYWQSQGSPVTSDEREQGSLHAKFSFAVPASIPWKLLEAADACLAWGGEPPFDTEAPDGVVCENAGIFVLPLGGDALVLARDISRIIDGSTGRVSERRFAMPPDYPWRLSEELFPEITECGDGALVLHSTSAIAFMGDGIMPPHTRWWRRDGAGAWTAQEFFPGHFLACGPDWTLLARWKNAWSEHPFEYGQDIEWKVEVVGAYPYELPELPAGRRGCAHSASPVAWLGFGSGDVFAAGPACGAPRRLVVLRWDKTSPRAREQMVLRHHKIDGFFSRLSGGDPDNVLAIAAETGGSSREWAARFDGKRWLGPVPAPEQEFFGVLPRGREGTSWQYVAARVPTSSGDVWVAARTHQRDCGRCFMYDALLRIRPGGGSSGSPR